MPNMHSELHPLPNIFKLSISLVLSVNEALEMFMNLFKDINKYRFAIF